MRVLVFADIHIGSIKDTTYVYNVITDIIEKEIIFKKTDLVVIAGDYFHKILKGNDEYITCAINVMTYLVRACAREKTKIRIVYGTESHEMNQYRILNPHVMLVDIDMKIINTVTEETIGDKSLLFIPEEYIEDKHEFYKDYLYSNKHYDYVFGHGVISEGMPMVTPVTSSVNKEKHVPIFKSGELSSVSDLCIFGHYHCHTDMGNNVYYLGSLFRDSFGEEEPKGYGIIEGKEFTFIENKEAYVFKTYDLGEISNSIQYFNKEDLIKTVNQIKEENKEIFSGEKTGKIRIKITLPENVETDIKETLHDILFSEKNVSLLTKESSSQLVDEVAESLLDDENNSELLFILDNSLPIADKIYRYINKEYDEPISIETIEKYIMNAIKNK